jgi:anti-anti-sigma regulatory factor
MDEQTHTWATKAFKTTVTGDTLTILIRKEFHFSEFHREWAKVMVGLHPGPFRKVIFDLAHCGSVSSTFFAGLVQLHQAYTSAKSEPIELRNPDPRVARNLTMLHLDQLFVITST